MPVLLSVSELTVSLLGHFKQGPFIYVVLSQSSNVRGQTMTPEFRRPIIRNPGSRISESTKLFHFRPACVGSISSSSASHDSFIMFILCLALIAS